MYLYFNLIIGRKNFLELKHLTKLADAISSKAYRAWHTGEGCLNDCFHFAMQRLLQSFQHSNVSVSLEKGGNFNRQKDFKQEHCFVQNFNMSYSKGSKKKRYVFDI